MPRKKKQEEITLTFTGKMVVIVELEEFGPMEFTIDDKDTAKDIMHVILGVSGTMEPKSYSAKEEKTLRKLLKDRS